MARNRISALEESNLSTQGGGWVQNNRVKVLQDKRYDYDGFGRLIRKRIGSHTEQHYRYDHHHRLTQVAVVRAGKDGQPQSQVFSYQYDALGRRIAKTDSFGTTVFTWEGMRLLQESRGAQASTYSAVISYVCEPDSYVPLARLDADGEGTEKGGQGTTQDAQQLQTSKTIAASASQASAGGQKHQNYSQQPANDSVEARYWQALNPRGAAPNTGTDRLSANAKLCEVYYFHTDQVGLPEELSNAQGQIIWQAQYKTWGSTVEERWEARRLHGAKVQGQAEGDTPEGERQEQNLRFQGQYLDRETGLQGLSEFPCVRLIEPSPIS